MNKVFCVLTVFVFSFMLFAQGSEQCKPAAASTCPMMKEKSCKLKGSDCMVKANAGPYTVSLCKEMKKKSCICIMDSSMKNVKIKDLSVLLDGKSIKTKKDKCGYELSQKIESGELKISFKVDKQAYETTLSIPQKAQAGIINENCPVMDGKVNSKITTVYKDKTIGFCCESCLGEFNKNPERYLDKLKN